MPAFVQRPHFTVELFSCRIEHPWPAGRWFGWSSAAATGQHVDSGGCDWSGEWRQCHQCCIAGHVGRAAWLARECHWALWLPCKTGTDTPGVPRRIWEIWAGNDTITACQKLCFYWLRCTCRVATNLENLEYSGISLNMENSEFCATLGKNRPRSILNRPRSI